jgi:tripartite-type tricarboxylate transporter receptor subunit TctC
MKRILRRTHGAVFLAVGCAVLPASAQTNFTLQGKIVTIYVAGGAGGGVDAYARTIAPFFSKYMPGNPAVNIANMPGAGGAQAVQYLYNVAPRDGSAIGSTNAGPIAQPFLETSPITYELNKMHWIGSLARGNTVCAVWHTVDVKSLADARKKVVTVASTGARSAPTRSALLMNSFMGTQFKPISGYTGGTSLLALERGEVDATCTTLNSLRTTRPQWLAEGKLRILVHVAMEVDDEYKDVPRAIDFVENPLDKAALDFFLLPYEFNNPYYLPPGVPAESVVSWRKAFDETMKDPAYAAETKKRLQEVEPKSGEAVEKLVQQMYATPLDVVKRTISASDPTGKVTD